MIVLKIAAGFAFGVMILLFVLIFTIKNPETALYDKTVEMLMRQEGVTTDREIKERYPILIEVQSNISRIAELNQIVLSKIQSPTPITNEEEALQLENYMQRVRELRKGVRTDLSRLTTAYAEGRP